MLRPGTQLLAFLLAKFVSETAESEGFVKPTGLPRTGQPRLEHLTAYAVIVPSARVSLHMTKSWRSAKYQAPSILANVSR